MLIGGPAVAAGPPLFRSAFPRPLPSVRAPLGVLRRWPRGEASAFRGWCNWQHARLWSGAGEGPNPSPRAGPTPRAFGRLLLAAPLPVSYEVGAGSGRGLDPSLPTLGSFGWPPPPPGGHPLFARFRRRTLAVVRSPLGALGVTGPRSLCWGSRGAVRQPATVVLKRIATPANSPRG